MKASGFFTALVAVCLISSPTAGAAPTGWVFHQDGSYLGKQTLYVSSTGAVLKTSVATFILKPKQASVVAYSTKNKTFVEMPISQWKKSFAGYFAMTEGRLLKPGKGKDKISGVATQQYHLLGKNKQGRTYETDELWAAPGLGVPAFVVKTIASFIDVPDSVGIPVRIVRLKEGARPVTVLDTLKIDRAPVAAAMFTVPTGLRKVKTEVEVLLDEGAELSDDFMNDLPTSSKAGPTTRSAPGAASAATAPKPLSTAAGGRRR
jgi:hypothetical protein